MRRIRSTSVPLALAVFFLVLYTLTLSDGGDPGKSDDSWTLLDAARNLKPTYTTGYPLYMLLAVPGLRLPAPVESSTAFYASLLPVVAAVLLLYYCALRATQSAVLALGAATLFGLSHGVWLAATSVYVHGIALLAQWALYAALYHYERHPTPRRWLLVVAALGAGGCAHPLNLLLALPVLTWMWPMLRRRSLPRRYWAWSALILLLWASLYLYLPATSPRGARGDLRSLSGLFFYLTGEGRSGNFAWGDAWDSARLLASFSLRWLHPAWLVPAAAGAIVFLSRRKRLESALLVSQALLLLFITVYYSTGHPQFYACFLIGLFWLWVAVGAAELWRLLRGLAYGKLAAGAGAALLAVLALVQVAGTARLDYHVRRLRADWRPTAAVGNAMAEMSRFTDRAELWCDRELLPWLQTRSSGEGFFSADGRNISMDWRLSVAQPPDYALNYSPPALLFSRHIHHTDRRHAVRIEPYGARPPHFAPTDSGRWKPTWLEFDSLARQTPLRVLGLSVDWLDAQRLRVSSVVHVAGFHKPPERVTYTVTAEGGEVLGRSHDRLNHRRRILWRLLYYDELVDVREIRLSRAVGEQELIWITPDFVRPNMQPLPPPRIFNVMPGRPPAISR